MVIWLFSSAIAENVMIENAIPEHQKKDDADNCFFNSRQLILTGKNLRKYT